jgi:charged multivesicular body protein 2A
MAKDLVRTRNHIKKMIKMKTQIQAVALKIQMLKSTNTMAQAMRGVTKAMQRMNTAMNIPALQKIMMEFEKQSEMMDMKQEVMDDTIDDALADSDEEAETDAVVSQVLDELGLSLNGEMSAVPQNAKPQAVPSAGQQKPQALGAATDPADMDLQARLDNLRRNDD